MQHVRLCGRSGTVLIRGRIWIIVGVRERGNLDPYAGVVGFDRHLNLHPVHRKAAAIAIIVLGVLFMAAKVDPRW